MRGKPLGIVPNIGIETTCCIAASYAAKAYGVKTGTGVAEAKKLCPNIEFIGANPRRYVEFHNKILETVEKFIHVEKVRSIDEFSCRLMGKEQEIQNAIDLAQRIKVAVTREVGECLTSSIGLAQTERMSKLASDMQKPDGLTVLSKSNMPDKILHLDIDEISGIGPRMTERLAVAGIHTMADLWAANKHLLKSVWGGIEGERFWMDLHGIEPYRPPTQTRSIGHEHVLEPELRNEKGVSTYLQHLLAKAAARLRDKGFYCKHLTVSIKWMDAGGSYTVKDYRFHPTQETLVLLNLMKDGLLKDLPKKKPLKVGVTLDELVPADTLQYDLFNSMKPAHLDTALDKLNSRFGRDTIYFGGANPMARKAETRISFQRVPRLDEY